MLALIFVLLLYAGPSSPEFPGVNGVRSEEVWVAQFEVPEGIGRIPDPIGISADPQ